MNDHSHGGATRGRTTGRVRYEARRRNVVVVDVKPLSPNFVSVTFAGEELGEFTSSSFDDHVKFMLDTGADEMVRRDFTPRSFDLAKRELTLEFALHLHGAASDWARQAKVGMHAVIGGPRGSMILPLDYDWHVLAGDLSALPAIHRRLEELPPRTQAKVVIQVDDLADVRELNSAADVEVQWVESGDQLTVALRILQLPEGEGFVWCAGEAAVMARIRDILQKEKGVSRDAMRVSAYWKQGSESFHENL